MSEEDIYANLERMEKYRRKLMKLHEEMQQDIAYEYDHSPYNTEILKNSIMFVRSAIRRIEEGQDQRDKILHEGKYKPQ